MWGIKHSDRGLREINLSLERIVADFSTGSHDSATRGRGIEFVSYREYEPSDSARDIAWRAMARTDNDEILSKNFAPEREMGVLVVADEREAMRFPDIKRAYASSLVRLFALSAFKNDDRFAVIGSGSSLIYSDRVGGEDDLNIFLDSADDARKRRAYRPDSRNLCGLLLDLDLKNTLVVFLTDLSDPNWVPLKALREFDQGNNVRSVVVVLDEWSAFEPSSHSIVFENAEGKTATLDLRKGGGVDREVQAFQDRLADIRQRGKSTTLSVVTVPLADDEPLRSFCKQWDGRFED